MKEVDNHAEKAPPPVTASALYADAYHNWNNAARQLGNAAASLGNAFGSAFNAGADAAHGAADQLVFHPLKELGESAHSYGAALGKENARELKAVETTVKHATDTAVSAGAHIVAGAKHLGHEAAVAGEQAVGAVAHAGHDAVQGAEKAAHAYGQAVNQENAREAAGARGAAGALASAGERAFTAVGHGVMSGARAVGGALHSEGEKIEQFKQSHPATAATEDLLSLGTGVFTNIDGMVRGDNNHAAAQSPVHREVAAAHPAPPHPPREHAPQKFAVNDGDSYWSVARRIAGEDSSNAEVASMMGELQRQNGNKALRKGDQIQYKA